MASESLVTTDHDTIRRWIEERGGAPAVVERTHTKEGSGILRVNFPGYSGEKSLEEIDWEEFFEIFDARDLAFLYQENLVSGEQSRFFKFVKHHEAEDAES